MTEQARARAEDNKAKAEAEQAKAEAQQARAEAEQARAEAEQIAHNLRDIQESWNWRLTKPIYQVFIVIKKAIGTRKRPSTRV